MQTKTSEAYQAHKADAITFERSYPGDRDQAHRVRADLLKIAAACPVLDDLVLLASELAANAIVHSRSGDPGGAFKVQAIVTPGVYAWVEVTDQGGPWGSKARAADEDVEHGRGLFVIGEVAGEGNWGISGDESSRSAWFRLEWDRP